MTPKSKKEAGRPQKEIDWVEFQKLCSLHCTLVEIAEFFDTSEDTIERAVKRKYNANFAEIYRRKSSKGKISLRRRMYETAMSGNFKGSTTMQIWLSKNMLGFSDKIEQKTTDETDPSKKVLTVKTDPAEVKSILEKIRKDC